ncbi:phosphomethylpyrimidine synthase [candidate division WOR_3 bacterium SM23_60]|uniref:Phosphomethylpyrimidine synthase n=1 Tax=candidate division WOR_3 bacterium SM23_60 TaxID=1703780 RepID=A0A0S8GA62_UNCW3|nr:MAG: phosphomethylpyrimidine synthase [candidate division WOR_3 bacterium SM23_60]
MQKVLARLAHDEGVSQRFLREGIKTGRIVLVKNKKHRIKPLAIGEGTRVKINANIGTSPDVASLTHELKKLKVAIEAGADTVMDLSTGGNINHIRGRILSASTVPVGTVPIYQAAIESGKKKRPFIKASVNAIFDVIERHLDDGVDFITVHCGVTCESIEGLPEKRRVCGVVSRGGSMMIEWMAYNKRENPLYEYYDRLLKLAKKYDATLSLGDGLRPGSIADATDRYQIKELIAIGELVKWARTENVSVMVEGPGHIPLHEIEANMRLQKSICDGAPFYVLGPLVTDIGAGHDHIVSAIGGALAAFYGADYLCYVTPSEHLALPTVEEVREGVIASKLAAHAADIARGNKRARDIDLRVSKARYALDWSKVLTLVADPAKATKIFKRARSHSDMTCTMCGEFCAMKKTREVIRKKRS